MSEAGREGEGGVRLRRQEARGSEEVEGGKEG